MNTKRSVFGKLMMIGSLLLSTVSYAQTTDNFFTDFRDGKVYKFVVADDQVWMSLVPLKPFQKRNLSGPST